jgi:hypothetical protein
MIVVSHYISTYKEVNMLCLTTISQYSVARVDETPEKAAGNPNEIPSKYTF